MTSSEMIRVVEVRKLYAGRMALDGISFGVAAGSIVGLLGRNGAGKTTTLRILSGILRPTSGEVVIDGEREVHASTSLRARLGYLPESAPLYPELRVGEHLAFRAAQKQLSGAQARSSVEQALTAVGARDLRHRICGQLSRGMRQRVALADAIMTRPKVLLLDEPTSGLDPSQTREIRELIRSLAATCTVVVSTHVLSEVDALCDAAVVIDRGRVVAQGSLADLHRLGQGSELTITLRCDAARANSALGELADVTMTIAEVEPGVVRVTLTCAAARSIDALAEQATELVARHAIPLREVAKRASSLEQVFAQLTATDGGRA